MGKFSRWQTDDIFSYFPQNTEFDISCKLSPVETMSNENAWNVKSFFSGKKNKKKKFNMLSVEIFPNMLSIK